jgi:hypothetical protein
MKAKCPIGAIPLQAAAKELAARGIATGGHKIFKQLRELGMLNGLHPSAKALRMGWLEEERGEWERGGMTGAYCRVFITTSGLDQVEFKLAKNETIEQEPKVAVHEYDLGVSENIELGF